MRRLIPSAMIAALGGMSLSACATMNPAMDLTPSRAPAFVAMAASSDMFEIESSRLALQRSRDPMNRMHAEMMIRDHTNMSAQLRAAAQSVGLGVPMQMLPMHVAMLNELSRSSNFNAVYRRQLYVQQVRQCREVGGDRAGENVVASQHRCNEGDLWNCRQGVAYGRNAIAIDVDADIGRRWRCFAIEAADGVSGLKVLRSDARIDLLITDVGLPGGMNGRQVAEAARQVRPELKVLFITGYAQNAGLSNGHLRPGMHVLTKPFAIEALSSRIKALISNG